MFEKDTIIIIGVLLLIIMVAKNSAGTPAETRIPASAEYRIPKSAEYRKNTEYKKYDNIEKDHMRMAQRLDFLEKEYAKLTNDNRRKVTEIHNSISRLNDARKFDNMNISTLLSRHSSTDH
jgi:hypothetical protein